MTELASALALSFASLVPEDGAVDGVLHPKWHDACAYAAQQVATNMDRYRERARGDDRRAAIAHLVAEDGRRIRNEWLAANG